jgi:hypothetical protein
VSKHFWAEDTIDENGDEVTIFHDTRTYDGEMAGPLGFAALFEQAAMKNVPLDIFVGRNRHERRKAGRAS